MKGEGLPRIGNGLGFVNDEAGDGGRFLVGNVPFHQPVHVTDRRRAVDQQRAVCLRSGEHASDIGFVGDLADDLLDDVLERDQAHHLSIFVDDDGEMRLLSFEGAELVL